MVTFVLVHGAWHGAWCWRRVARRLTARGHEVFTPTITGLAERSHLLRGDIDLDTQILDVVNVMKWQGLKDVVLVGHSYGGMVVSGVAEKMEKAIASFVMLDAFFPEDGQSLIDVNVPPDRVRDAILTAERSGATVMPAAGGHVQRKRARSHLGRCTVHAASDQMLYAEAGVDGRARPRCKEGLHSGCELSKPAVRPRVGDRASQGLARLRSRMRP
jgi:pimeloyl-ACP methyl ester carboxylesterase